MAAFFILLARCAVNAAEPDWRDIQYRERTQVNIECGVALLCEIELEKGAKVSGMSNALASAWNESLSYSDAPHLRLKPLIAGLDANAIISTSNPNRTYYLWLHSTASRTPLYARFLFTEYAKAHERRQERRVAVAPTAAPITTLEAACALPQAGWHSDNKPKEYAPRQICQTSSATFIALPTDATDIPTPYAVTADGDRLPNYRYDTASRTIVLSEAGAKYALVSYAGGKPVRLILQRDEVKK